MRKEKKKKMKILYHLNRKEIKTQDQKVCSRSQCNDEVWWTQQPMHALSRLLFHQSTHPSGLKHQNKNTRVISVLAALACQVPSRSGGPLSNFWPALSPPAPI